MGLFFQFYPSEYYKYYAINYKIFLTVSYLSFFCTTSKQFIKSYFFHGILKRNALQYILDNFKRKRQTMITCRLLRGEIL